jgi:hypothetical protein
LSGKKYCNIDLLEIKNAETDLGVSENEIEDFFGIFRIFSGSWQYIVYQRNVFVPNELP